MLHKLRRRIQDEKGFTLIELLVVILIIGILAAIAIPSFINQRTKAQDASTKSMARTAQTAMESYATDNNGDYTGATPALLHGIEPTIPLSGDNAVSVQGAPDATTYSVRSTGKRNAWFQVTRNSDGTFSRTCDGGGAPNNGGCVNGSW